MERIATFSPSSYIGSPHREADETLELSAVDAGDAAFTPADEQTDDGMNILVLKRSVSSISNFECKSH